MPFGVVRTGQREIFPSREDREEGFPEGAQLEMEVAQTAVGPLQHRPDRITPPHSIAFRDERFIRQMPVHRIEIIGMPHDHHQPRDPAREDRPQHPDLGLRRPGLQAAAEAAAPGEGRPHRGDLHPPAVAA